MLGLENILEVVNLSGCDQRKDLDYFIWHECLHDNKFNIGPGHTIDSNHGLC